MRILVLDTIHGGRAIGRAFTERGDIVDCVDVYRGESTVDVKTALTRDYDLIVAPVHLDPDHPLLTFSQAPVVSHHEAVRHLLTGDLPEPMIEITGARGKTTTAHALAFLMQGEGILHTSTGTYRFPEKIRLSQSSITPASMIAAARMAREINGWLIIEESLGVTGAGTLAIITSDSDYFFAAGKKSALTTKIASAKRCNCLLLAKNIQTDFQGHIIHMEDVASCIGTECCISLSGKTCSFSNPLLAVPGYHTSLVLAAAAAMILGINPEPLSSFSALAGRMSVSYEKDLLIIDNANSGTNVTSAVEAVQYARSKTGNEPVTLVIGQEEGDGAVCEGFAFDQIQAAIDQIRPENIIWVGIPPGAKNRGYDKLVPLRITDKGSIVLSVKTWR
jgi:UDP-N-acetylmuramyl pentapeptide synthase